ncbi:MAG: glycosyltransferase [Myxococcota bacterium]|nr:glycosyltransferase [Myxococcota bacterium]
MRRKVLVLCDYFLPGFRAGGTVRSLANLIELLGDELSFRVITRSRDYTVREPYPDLPTEVWLPRGKAEVLYLPEHRLRPPVFRRLLRDTEHDVLYLNSVFSPAFTLVPLTLRRMRLAPDRSVVVSPNGELAPEALAIKSTKKRGYLSVARPLGLYRGVTWRASDEKEERCVRQVFGSSAAIDLARNLPAPRQEVATGARSPKEPGRLRVVYLSRLAPIKNLDLALEAMRGLRGDVVFDIYGPMDEPAYWEACERIIAALPAGVRVAYHGAVPAEEVTERLGGYDLFLLPSKSESFGYAILEALAAGLPVLISEGTPWRHLEPARVGWDLPLEAPERFGEVLQRCVDMSEAEHRELREHAVAYAREATPDLDTYRRLLGLETAA